MSRLIFVISLILIIIGKVTALEEQTQLLVTPLAGAKIVVNEVVISAAISGPLTDEMDLAQARLFVDGLEVTSRCLRTDRLLSYRPLVPFSAGAVSARLEFPNGIEKSWSFSVSPSSAISSVTHSAAGTLSEYEEFKVTMKARAGLKAGFKIGPDDKLEHPLVEVEPGLYSGKYVVGRRDYYLGEPIIGILHLKNEVVSLNSKKPVTLFGNLFRVVILSPAYGSKVPHNFDIKGRTRPNSRITFVPELSFSRNTRAPNTRGSGGDSSFDAHADDKGFFSVNYGIPISIPNLSVVMSIFATTPDGERSVPVVLRYNF